MDINQLISYLKKTHQFTKFAYNSPEQFLYEPIIGSYKDIAPFVLYRNKDAFKNRIDGNIVDKWISKDTFKDIYKYFIEILESLCDKEEYQNKLLQIFKSFDE